MSLYDTFLGGLNSRYFYIEWDLSSVPDDIEVTGALLFIYCFEDNGYAGYVLGDAQTLDEYWEEDTITWNNKPDLGAYYIAMAGPPVENYWWFTDISPFVIGWLNGTLDNHGLCIYFNENYDEGDASFRSSDYGDNEYAPMLTIDYNPPGIESTSIGKIKVSFK